MSVLLSTANSFDIGKTDWCNFLKPLYENQVIWETDDVTHSDGEGYATHPKERRSCPETIRHNYVNEFKPLISVVPGKDNIAYSSENVGIEKPMKTSDTRKGDDVEIYKSAKYQVGYKERVTILAKGTSVKVAVGEYVMDGDVPVEEEDDVYHEPIFNDSQDDLPTADQFYHVLEKPDKINPRTSTLYNSASTCINMQAANDANRGPSPNTYDKIDLSGELREMDMSDIQNSSEMLTLDEWLGALGLEMYHDTLVENGWVNLMVLHEMTEADLDMLNIDNKGHRLKMLHAIQYLKGNNSTSDKTVVI